MTPHQRARWRDSEPEDEALSAFFPSDSRCPPPELVEASLMGTLPPDLQRRVAEHTAQCRMCEALADALDDPSIGDLTADADARIRARIRTGIVGARDESARRRMWRLSAAALVAALIGGAALVWQLRVPSRQEATSVLRLEKAAVRIPGDTGIVWRGAERADAVADLRRALEPYEADRYAEAARRLRDFVARRPDSAAGRFYLGVSELFLGADDDAVASLEAAEKLAKSQPGLANDTAWYLALAYQRTGRDGRAAAKLQALCEGASTRAAPACAAARELAGTSATPQSR